MADQPAVASAAAGHTAPELQSFTEVQDKSIASASGRTSSKTVLIGGHFHPEVRRALLLIQAESQNEGKNLKQLLGEAIICSACSMESHKSSRRKEIDDL